MGALPHARLSLVGREPTPAPARLGRFELIERIGSGGMAEVFRAAVTGPEGFRRELVLKRVLPELSARPRFTQMFVNEAKISALLAHPNIVQIFEFGESDGAYFIAMESVRGLTLREVMTNLRKQETVMPVLAAAAIMREVLIALDYAHNLRGPDGRPLEIVHRDISPSNIILADTGVVKVLDFGIARAADLVADDEGKVVKGKIAYLAPEQVTIGEIDSRVDIFATGCVLHEILTGRPMFRAHNNLQRKIELLAQPTPPPSSVNSDVPAALDAIVARATARDRNARYPTAAAMLADLESYLEDFQSSSRALLRLVRLMLNDPRGGNQPAADGQAAAGARSGAVAAAAGVTAGSAVVASAVPEHLSNTGATKPAKLLPGDKRLRTSPSDPRSDQSHEHHSSGGHAQGSMAAPAGSQDPGAPELARRWFRFHLDLSSRRWLIAGTIALAVGVVCGVFAGTRALLGPVPRPHAPIATSPVTTGSLILIRFLSVPPGARIVDDRGHAIGTTPVTLPMTSSRAELSFRFEKDGYKAATGSAIPDADKTIAVELRPTRRADKAARKVAKTKRVTRSR